MLVARLPARKIHPPTPMVKRFLDDLLLECGLAGSTVTVYQSDLAEVYREH